MAEMAVSERMERVPVERILIRPGFNPRSYFDPDALAELTESVRQRGVIQSVTLRPHPEKGEGFFELLAGERRWRAANAVGLVDIPAVIRDVDDAEALAISVAENSKRDDMTPADEAKTARRALQVCSGDEAEAAKMLGWPLAKLKQRLLLLHASEETLQMLNEGRIKIGHAELLSTLTESRQKAIVAKVIEHGISVEELKRQLAAYTLELSAARFDTAGCAGCPHNSTVQASLFEQHVGAGRCSNSVCWQQKTDAQVLQRRQQAEGEYNVVWLDREKDPATYRKLDITGTQGVGSEQFNGGCKGCKSFGALVCTRPGKEGAVAGGVCFDLSCRSQKVAAYQESIREDAPADDTVSSGGKTSGKVAGKSKSKAKVSVGSGSPRKVTEQVHAFLRGVAVDSVIGHDVSREALIVIALRNLKSRVGNPEVDMAKLEKQDRPALLAEQDELIRSLVGEKVEMAHRAGNSGKDADSWVKAAAVVVGSVGVDLAGRFKLTREFLDAHTKSGLESLLEQAEFWRSCEGEGDEAKKKAVAKLLTGKREDIVNAIHASTHDFRRFVPASVTSELDALRKGIAGK